MQNNHADMSQQLLLIDHGMVVGDVLSISITADPLRFSWRTVSRVYSNGAVKKKHPVSGSSAEGNPSLMNEVNKCLYSLRLTFGTTVVSKKEQHIGGWSTRAKDGFHFCHPGTECWGCSGYRLTKTCWTAKN